LFLALAAPAAMADEPPLTYDRIRLAVQVSEEVENDTLNAVLYSQREGREPGKLADEVNQTITWAVAQAKQAPEVKVQTLSYQTTPLHSQQTLTGWRVRQAISLESRDPATLGSLVGRLQERLAVQAMSYGVSPELRASTEDRLIAEALKQFRKRASLIGTELGSRDYRIVEMQVDTGGSRPLRPVPMYSAAIAAKAAVAPPSIEAGTQTLEVGVNATIELQLP